MEIEANTLGEIVTTPIARRHDVLNGHDSVSPGRFLGKIAPAMKNAVAYYVGADPGLRQQKDAVQTYAAANKLKIVRDFWDTTDASPISERNGFAALLAYTLTHGTKVVLTERPDRLGPEPVARVTVHMMCDRNGVELVPVTEPEHFDNDKCRQIAASADTVLSTARMFATRERLARMKKGRDTASARLGYRIEGNPSWGRFNVEHVSAARRHAAAGKSLRQISAELSKLGYLNNASKPYGAESVARMIRGDAPGSNVRAGRTKKR